MHLLLLRRSPVAGFMILLAVLLASVGIAAAQDAAIVTAGNVAQLRPVAAIDYASLPDEAGRVESGGFVMNRDASRFAVRNRDNGVVVIERDGTIIDTFEIAGADGIPDTILDMTFNSDGHVLAVLASDGAEYTIVIRLINIQSGILVPFPNSPDVPLRLWLEPQTRYIWLEVAPADAGQRNYVLRLFYGLPGETTTAGAEPYQLPSGPENDPEAFARIGRIAPPRAVTSSQDGEVKLWNLQTGAVTASARVGVPAVFGGLNTLASYLAWRDPQSTGLHVLNLPRGRDRLVAELDGEYINYILLSVDADVILGVHVGGEPVVVAWNTDTGVRIELGPYRDCERTPDMARLSADGRTLVIGCDTGLDIWQIVEADEMDVESA